MIQYICHLGQHTHGCSKESYQFIEKMLNDALYTQRKKKGLKFFFIHLETSFTPKSLFSFGAWWMSDYLLFSCFVDNRFI